MAHYTITILDERGSPIDEFGYSSGELLIGRTENNDIVLPSTSVSRRHARIYLEAGSCVVEDLGSSNGVFVDGQRITRPVGFDVGANITVGNYSLLVSRRSRGGAQPSRAQRSVGGAAARASIAYLVRIDPAQSGAILTIRGPRAVLGRSVGSEVQIAEKGISRHHGTFEQRGAQWVYVDENSANGSWINDVAVQSPIILREGDHLRVGPATMVFTNDPGNVDLHGPEPTMMLPARAGSKPVAELVPWIIVGVLTLVVLSLGGFVLLNKGDDSPQLAEVASDSSSLFHALEIAESAIQAERWSDALSVLDEAKAAHGESDSLRRLRTQADSGRSALRSFEECVSKMEAGEGLELASQPHAAAETFEDARTCLREIPEASVYHARAQERLNERVLPSLMTLHRALSGLAIQAQEFSSAITSLERALAIQEELPEALRGSSDAIKRQLRSAHIRAGDHAWERRAWSRAVEHYEAAGQIEELDEGRRSRVSSHQR